MPGLNHVGLTVCDLERSLAFYRDTVGMQPFVRVRQQGAWFDTLTHNRGADIDVAMLRLGDFVLQLVEYKAAGGGELGLAHNRVGTPHLCIEIDDVDAKHRELSASGSSRPTPIVEIAGAGMRSFYVADPDGVPVEFLARAPRPLA